MTIKAKKVLVFIVILTGVITACLGLETQHSNHLGWALLFCGAAFSTIGSLYLGALSLQCDGIGRNSDRLLWLPGLGVLIISLVTPLEYIFLPPVLPRSDHAQNIGLILFAGGLAFYLLSLHSEQPWSLPSKRLSFRNIPSMATFWHMIFCPISASLLLVTLALGIGYSSLIGLGMLFVVVLPGLFNKINRIDQQARMIG